jgi:murein L,D-transpeptidase YafK
MKKFLVIFLAAIAIISLYYFYPENRLPKDCIIKKIVVIKSKRLMEVYSNDELVKTYKISLGRSPVGDKEFEGDKKTPEGRYVINGKNSKSGFHKNLGISYPNDIDIREAKVNKLNPGGEIKIHGIRNGCGFIGKFQRWMDSTAGCIALTDEEVDELYAAVEIGTPITIVP